ncbi:hypothetical protein [Pseudoalteromonas ardens]|uniref:ABC transporter n=1 Tax=Pseudoalteromonas rubra TaxID=43658 RepID=A0A0L0EQT9_9GAMM|nr:hypothetical protein [Pseudoalteromonas sp. R96]KNC66761.1 hypothetical protein AC626_14960 [Pseudoalteromonas rubra]MDK1314038.1 hypothetical protein [Pseudoalteromonas sp. R96]
MYSFLHVEFTRAFLSLVRYPANFVSTLFINVLMFYGLFIGASFLAGRSTFGDALDAMVVGYAAWVLVNRSFGKTPQLIEAEAATGVLESVFLSRYNTSLIYAVRGLVEATLDMVMIAILINLIILLTGSQITYSFAVVLPIISIVLASIGCSLVAGGFALQFKRISAILPSFQFALMFLMFAPFETWGEQTEAAVMFLPMVPSVVLLRELMVYEMALDYNLVLIAFANGVTYLLIGATLFNLMINRARNKGIVGGY